MSPVLIVPEEITVLRFDQEVLNQRSLQCAWECLKESGAPVLQLDLGSVQYPTAEGLGALVVLNRELRARQGGLLLVNVPSVIREVLAVTHLMEVLEVQTEEEASS